MTLLSQWKCRLHRSQYMPVWLRVFALQLVVQRHLQYLSSQVMGMGELRLRLRNDRTLREIFGTASPDGAIIVTAKDAGDVGGQWTVSAMHE